MHAAVNLSKTEYQLQLLGEERKQIDLLKTDLEMSIQLNIGNPMFDFASVQRSIKKIQTLERAVEFKINFLKDISSDFSKVCVDIEKLLSEARERLTKL